MSDNHHKPPSEANAGLEREIRQGRKFTAQEAMARLAGPGAMKGASPVSPLQQAELEIATWLMSNLPDSGGALKVVLNRHLKGSELLLDTLDRPLVALTGYCRSVLAADNLLREIVREADVEWGRAMEERPYFEREDVSANPDDPYTFESVRKTLSNVLKLLPDENG